MLYHKASVPPSQPTEAGSDPEVAQSRNHFVTDAVRKSTMNSDRFSRLAILALSVPVPNSVSQCH